MGPGRGGAPKRRRGPFGSRAGGRPRSAGGEQPAPKQLGLREFIALVRERNEQISYQGSEWAISREAVRGAKAIFEPALVGSYQYQEDKRRNTVQDQVSQGFAPFFQERSQSYQAAVEGSFPRAPRCAWATP